MKRGKDDDNIMGPMFPRLHINDTEKGGPRAPPRNKMALYERLTVPSHTHNSGVGPPNRTKTNLVSSPLNSQGCGHERNMFFPLYQSPLAPTHPADSLPVHHSDVANLSRIGMQAHLRKKLVDEDDFTVPIFSQSEKDIQNNNGENNIDGGKNPPFTSKFSARPNNYCGKETNPSNSPCGSLLQGGRNCGVDNLREFASTIGHTEIPISGSSSTEVADGPLLPISLVNQEFHEKNTLDRLQENSSCLRGDCESSSSPAQTTSGNGASVEVMKDTNKGSLKPKLDSCAGQGCRKTDLIDRGSQIWLEKDGSLQQENVNRGDDISDSIMESGFIISPDDVVGVIGLKHFWKTRELIARAVKTFIREGMYHAVEVSNPSQVLFAKQLFDLHRLIKVQRLIAGSPDILLESSPYVCRPSLKDSHVKQVAKDGAVKTLPCSHKKNGDCYKANHRIEGSAENVVGKAVTCSPLNAVRSSNYQSFSGDPALSLVNTDSKMNPWGFPQTGHQWLVPVMSPSEGLIYKPYPATGSMALACGDCGPTPIMGNFMSSAYRVRAPGLPCNGPAYFPPYGMPVINPAPSGSAVDQMKQLSGSDPNSQTAHQDGDGPNFNIQQQTSCIVQSEKNGGISGVGMAASKCSELRRNTASCPSPRVRAGDGAGRTSGGTDAHPLFSQGPAPQVLEVAVPPHDTEHELPIRVIRVVPHNRRSASESANRIFQAIQNERQQHESN